MSAATLLTAVIVLCVVALPLYLIHLSLVIRRVWTASRARGALLVAVVPLLLLPLSLPVLYAY